MSERVDSPCVGICQLDAEQRCLGCGRTVDEVCEWPLASPARQRVIVSAARQRLARMTRLESPSDP